MPCGFYLSQTIPSILSVPKNPPLKLKQREGLFCVNSPIKEALRYHMSSGGWEVDIADYIKDIPMQPWSSSAPAREHNPSVLWIPRARQMPESLFPRPGTRHPMTAGVTSRPAPLPEPSDPSSPPLRNAFFLAFFSSPASPLVSSPCGELQCLRSLDKGTLSVSVKRSGRCQSRGVLVTVRVKCRGREDRWGLIIHVKQVWSAARVRSGARVIPTVNWGHLFRLFTYAWNS